MTPRRARARDPKLTVDDYRLRYAQIPGPHDPKSRRMALLLDLTCTGWVIGATPIHVWIGDLPAQIYDTGAEGDRITLLLDTTPKDKSEIVVRQGGLEGRSPHVFSTRRIPAKPARGKG